MTISIQLVEVPDNEKILSRQVILPASGGTIGRAYDCTLVLPDFERKLSRKHVSIELAKKGGFQITDHSVNGATLNAMPLRRGIPQKINDGDILKLGDYTLLLSDMVPMLNERVDDGSNVVDKLLDPVPAFENLQVDELSTPLDDLHSNDIEAFDPVEFSPENVIIDDQFGHDPFDDTAELKAQEPQFRNSPSLSADVVTLDKEDVTQSDENAQLNQSLNQLQHLIQQQERQQIGMHGQEKLLECMSLTLDRFLEEFEPTQLESMFDEYISGWGGRDKKYWRLYKKHFSRRRDRNEFHQQFTAMFLEEMRRKK